MSSSSLRDSYNNSSPTPGWSFVPPPPSGPSAASASSSAPSSSYQWNAPRSRYPPSSSRYSMLDFSGPDGQSDSGLPAEVSLLFKGLVASAFLQYTTTALVMPWEVGKLLLQVQWVPKDGWDGQGAYGDANEDEDDTEGERGGEEVFSESSEDESYFADPNVPPNSYSGSVSKSRYPPPKLVDDDGYVLRTSVLEEGTRPEYVIPVGSASGTWDMIKRVATFRGEGWFSLWKGLLTSCVYDALFSNIQPLIHTTLETLFFIPISAFQQPPLLIPIASHVFTGFLLSPIDLVRTRLVVQSSMSRHRTYSGPIDALSQILAYEGGFRSVYFHPELFFPAILDNTLRPLVHVFLPPVLASLASASIFGGGVAGQLEVSPETHPITWGLAEFAAGCLGLLITLPIETVRRRLQVQTRSSAQDVKLRTCVETRPMKYHGVVDTLWRILTEERSDLPVKKRKGRKGRKDQKSAARDEDEQEESHEQTGWIRNTGIGQLYRGLGMRLGASLIVFLLAAGGGDEPDSGWAEL